MLTDVLTIEETYNFTGLEDCGMITGFYVS